MPSLRSRLIRFLLTHRHWFRFRLKGRTAIDWSASIPQLRQEAEKSSKLFGKLPEGIEVSLVTIDGLPAEWILPSQAKRDKVILYFHGGGYVMGSVQAHRSIVAKFVKGSEVGALLFGYRLAPEHPFPAALEDSLAAYRWLLAQGVSPSHVVFVGDSAGGGLGLATLIALRDQGIPLPAAAVALSPWTDLKCTGESLRTKAKKDPLTWAESWTVFSKYYAGDNDPGNPWISPLYGNLRGLPPMLIHVGEHEVLLDDSTRFAEKAKNAGVDITLRVGEGMVHCFPVLAPLFPEAKQAMDEICTFIKTHVASVLNFRHQLMAWASTHNLNRLINFHNYVRGLLKERLKDLEAARIQDIEIKVHKEALYDYDRMLHINTLLMMYSYLEEWLYHCWKKHVPNVGLVNGKGSLGRFSNVAKQLGIDLSSELWQDLKNGEKIRNCLLHAHGRISLLRDPQKVRRIIERKTSGLEIIKDRVVISSGYLKRFSKSIWELLDIMNKWGAQHRF